MDGWGHQLEANLPAAKPTGIRGGSRRGTVAEAGGGIEVPTLLWEAQSGSSRQGSMQGVGAEGGWGGMPIGGG